MKRDSLAHEVHEYILDFSGCDPEGQTMSPADLFSCIPFLLSLFWCHSQTQHDDKKAAGSFGLMTGMSNAAKIWFKKKIQQQQQNKALSFMWSLIQMTLYIIHNPIPSHKWIGLYPVTPLSNVLSHGYAFYRKCSFLFRLLFPKI